MPERQGQGWTASWAVAYTSEQVHVRAPALPYTLSSSPLCSACWSETPRSLPSPKGEAWTPTSRPLTPAAPSPQKRLFGNFLPSVPMVAVPAVRHSQLPGVIGRHILLLLHIPPGSE